MKQLAKYADKQFNSLFESLSLYELTSDPETLHRIRVELKKIKSLFRLINYCTKNFHASEEYLPLKKIFTEAGMIREVDVAKELFAEYKIKMIHYEKKIYDQVKLVSVFRKNISSYKEAVIKKQNEIKKYFDGINSNCFGKYILSRKLKLQKQFYPEPAVEKLHKSRKIIKEIIYLSGISRWRKKNLIPHYDKAQELIGSWHDKIFLLNLLKELNIDFHKKDIKMLESKCQNDLNILKKMIPDSFK